MPIWTRPKSKPNPGIGIDWGHPLAPGLKGFYACNEASGPNLYDAVGISPTLVATNFGSANPWGSGSAGAALAMAAANNRFSALVPTALQLGWPITIAGGFRLTGTPAQNATFIGLQYDSALGSPYWECSLYYNAGLTMRWASGSTGNASGVATISTNTDYVFSATFTSASQNCYINGAKSSISGSVASADPAWSATSQLNTGSPVGSSVATNFLVFWLAWWNRDFAASEHAALAGNPWQFFRSPRIQGLYRAGSTIGGSATLSAATGVFSFSGNAANLLAGRVLGAATGAYGLTGQAAALLSGRVLPAATGTYALTGIDAGLLAGRVLTASTGVYTVTGNNAGLLAGRVIAASTGVYVLAGNAANLVFSGQPGAFTLVAETGTFSLTGNAAGLLVSRVLTAAPGSFALSSVGASLTWSGHITPSFIDPDEVTMITP